MRELSLCLLPCLSHVQDQCPLSLQTAWFWCLWILGYSIPLPLNQAPGESPKASLLPTRGHLPWCPHRIQFPGLQNIKAPPQSWPERPLLAPLPGPAAMGVRLPSPAVPCTIVRPCPFRPAEHSYLQLR